MLLSDVLLTAIGIFIVVALLGAILISYVLRNIETPKGLAFIHGPLAAVGLIILIIYSLYARPAPIVSLSLFVLAALGGFVLIYGDITGKSLPKWMALTHGIVAVIAFIFLLNYWINY